MPLTDKEYTELVSQGELPSPSEEGGIIQTYLASRAALKEAERSQRSDASFRAGLSPIARRACEVVARIREVERRVVWAPALEEDLPISVGGDVSVGVGGGVGGDDGVGVDVKRDDGVLFPGMMFGLAKDKMEATTLWRIVRRMPKGSLLREFLSLSLSLLTLTFALPHPYTHHPPNQLSNSRKNKNKKE